MLILIRIFHKATVDTTPEMDQNANKPVIPDDFITSTIYVIRDKKVSLHPDCRCSIYCIVNCPVNK
jgi:hypothetical protein